MPTLAEIAGLGIDWADDGTLTFVPDLVVDEAFSRPRERLRSVTLDPAACEPADQVQYWMYNGIAPRSDRERLAETGVRYELTLMAPHALGRERAKTLGHLHSSPAGSALNYPEICEVIRGKAIFVFQTIDAATRSAPFCAITEVNVGEKIIIPPNLHHLTINAGDEPMLFSDIIPLETKGIYQPLADMHGAAHLLTIDAGWIKNPNYTHAGSLERWSVKDYPALKLTSTQPLYQTFINTPEKLDWLVHPDQFVRVFPDIWGQLAPVIGM